MIVDDIHNYLAHLREEVALQQIHRASNNDLVRRCQATKLELSQPVRLGPTLVLSKDRNSLFARKLPLLRTTGGPAWGWVSREIESVSEGGADFMRHYFAPIIDDDHLEALTRIVELRERLQTRRELFRTIVCGNND